MRINLFLWFSLIFIYYTELLPWHFYYMIPVSFFLVYSISYQLDKRFAKKNPQTIAYSYEKKYDDIIYEFVNSNDILQDTYPLNLNNNGFKDFLFV